MMYTFAREYVLRGCQKGTASECARIAGYNNPGVRASQLLKTPDVIALIAEQEKTAIDHTTARMLQIEEQLEKEDINQAFVMRETGRLARGAERDCDKIKALENLGKWLGMDIQRKADVTDQFKDRSKDELEFFATHGFFQEASDSKSGRPN